MKGKNYIIMYLPILHSILLKQFFKFRSAVRNASLYIYYFEQINRDVKFISIVIQINKIKYIIYTLYTLYLSYYDQQRKNNFGCKDTTK